MILLPDENSQAQQRKGNGTMNPKRTRMKKVKKTKMEVM